MITGVFSTAVRLLPKHLKAIGGFTQATARLSMPVRMPSLSPTMTSGTIVKWVIKEGEQVEPGDVICEIQTDKAVVALEFDEEGVLAKIMVPENTPDVEVGVQIAVVAEPDENWEEVAASSHLVKPAPPSADSSDSSTKKAAASPPPTAASASGVAADHHFNPHLTGKAGPSVRLLLHLYEIDASQVTATGNRGTMLKSDVMQYISQHDLKPKVQSSPPPAVPTIQPASKPAASKPRTPTKPAKQPAGVSSEDGVYTDYPLSPYEIQGGQRILASKNSVPHSFTTVEVNGTKLLNIVQSLADKKVDVRLGDFVVKACSSSLQIVPEMNALYEASSESLRYLNSPFVTETVRSQSHRAFAYAALHLVDKGVASVSNERKLISSQIENGDDPESTGSVLSVYDLSETGVRECSSVVDASQTGVVAIGAPHPFLDPQDPHIVSQIFSITLCYDNRAVTEPVAARYLESVKCMLEDPELFIAGTVPETEGLLSYELNLDDVPVEEVAPRTVASLL